MNKYVKRYLDNPVEITMVAAWSLLVVLSLVVVNENLLSYINANVYTKVAAIVFIQGFAFVLLVNIRTLRQERVKLKRPKVKKP